MLARILLLYHERSEFFLTLLGQHLKISGIAILFAAVLGLCVGIFISEHERFSRYILGLTGVLYTIPSISLLGILIPLTGIGNKTAVIALTVYALLPMVRNTYAGIKSIDPEVVETAVALGSTTLQMLFRIKLPLALGVIAAGLRSMTVMTIALSGVAAFIGAGGLGVAVYRGITINNPAMTAAGSILIAVLALTVDSLLGLAERKIQRKRRRIK